MYICIKLNSMEKQLALVRKLQQKHSGLSLGGSLGLFLQGLDLRNGDYNNSDLDLTSDDVIPDFDVREEGCSADMHYHFEQDGIKVDIQVDENVRGIQVLHTDGCLYRVTPVMHIIGWKFKYATDGLDHVKVKHLNDWNLVAKEITKRTGCQYILQIKELNIGF